MNDQHPSESEWMSFLYEECNPHESEQLQLHLSACPWCRLQVDGWRRTMSRLDAWALPLLTEPPTPALPEVRSNADEFRTDRSPMIRHLSDVQRMPHAGSDVSPVAEHARSSPGGLTRPAWRSLLTAAGCLAAVCLAFLSGRAMQDAKAVDTTTLKSELRRELIRDLRQDVIGIISRELGPVVDARVASLRPDEAQLLPLIETQSSRVFEAAIAGWAQQDTANRTQVRQLLAGVLENQMALRTDLENLAIAAEVQILRTRGELARLAMSSGRESSGIPPVETEPQSAPPQM